MSDSNPIETFSYFAEQLNKLGIVYLHVVDPVADGDKRVSPVLRRKFARTYIVNGGFDFDSADAVIGNGEADLVAFGATFLANPDLRALPDQGAAQLGRSGNLLFRRGEGVY